MMHYRSWPLALAAAAFLTLAPGTAPAGDCGFKIDFEDFDPDLRICDPDLELKVKYEIEFDHSGRDDRFALILRPSECGRPLLDDQGQPMTFVVPLDCPKKWEGKDRDYEATVRFSIPAAAVRCPEEVRVQGAVVLEGTDAPLACKDKRVDVHGHYYVPEPVVVAAPAPIYVAAPPPVVYVQPAPVVVARPRPVVVSGYYGGHYVRRPVAHRRVVVRHHGGW